MGPSVKILVGITQRVVTVPSRSERRDALDQAWLPFLLAANLEPVLIPNRHPDPASYARRLGVRGLILSGGGNISPALETRGGQPPQMPLNTTDLAPERDKTETALLRASIEEGWPVIGVCRGMQVLNLFHGGALIAVQGHAGTRHPLTTDLASRVAGGYCFDREVNSFHDFGISPDGSAGTIRVLAEANGIAEAIAHNTLPHLGIMWHPERNQPFSSNDMGLFSRFFTMGSVTTASGPLRR